MVEQLILIACGCALLAIGYGLFVRREHQRRASRFVARSIAALNGIPVKVSEFCPPGKAYLVDPSVMGLGGGGQVLVINPKDYNTVVGMRNL